MSAPEVHWVKGNYTGSQPSWKTVLWAVLQLWNGRSACDTTSICAGMTQQDRRDEEVTPPPTNSMFIYASSRHQLHLAATVRKPEYESHVALGRGDGTVGRLLDSDGPAAALRGWGHSAVSSATRQQLFSTGMSGPDPMAQDTAVRRRLSAEPRTPFLPQMYCWDLVVQQLQSLTWLFLMAWLFNVAVFFFYFWGEKILSSNHTYLIAAIGATLNGPCLSSVMVMIRRLYLQWEA